MSRAGIAVGLIDDIPACQDLVNRIIKEAESQINRLNVAVSVQGGEEAWSSGRSSKL